MVLRLKLKLKLEPVSEVANCSQNVVSVEEGDGNEESGSLSKGEIIYLVLGIASFITVGIPTLCAAFDRWLMK